jgi:WhiB family redox-sensing transcriptional regulator
VRDHGIYSTYNAGCHCDDCRAAAARYKRRVRAGLPHMDGRGRTRLPVGDWANDGSCRGVDPDVFHPGKGGTTAIAKAFCAACPVCAECLEHALVQNEPQGVWGGKSERERRKLRKERAA